MSTAVRAIRAVVVGDLIDDIIVVPDGPVRPDTDTRARISRHEGGSAANTAAWMASLGAPVDFVGCVGAGDGERHSAALSELGVTAHVSEHPSLSTGTIVIVVEAEQRTMLTDRGANAAVSVDSVTDVLLARAGVLHLSGYSLVDAFSAADLGSLIDRAHGHGVLVSLDPGSAGFIVDYGVGAFREALRGVDLLLPNLDEGVLLAGSTDDVRIVDSLLEISPTVVLTRGSASVLVGRRGRSTIEVTVGPMEVVDPTGAGDAFTAGVLSALLDGRELEDAVRSGVHVASQAVTRSGARPLRR